MSPAERAQRSLLSTFPTGDTTQGAQETASATGLPEETGSTSASCPLGDKEQEPPAHNGGRGLHEAHAGCQRPKATFWPPGSLFHDKLPDIGPEKDSICWPRASEKPTFRTWENAYSNPSYCESCSSPTCWFNLCLHAPRDGRLTTCQGSPFL